MNHGSQRIQQERRIFSLGEEAGSEQGEHGQSERGTVKKRKSGEISFACQNCGSLKPIKTGEANRFCQNSCQHEWVVKKWYACSVCHAAIGLGGKTSSKLLNVSASNITIQWKKRGVASNRPKNGSWFSTTRKVVTAQNREISKLWIEYERAWMREIREEERSFSDWGSLWNRSMTEIAKVKSKEHYHSMTPEEKKERNNRCHQLRKMRHKEDPSTKSRDYEKIKNWKIRNPEKSKISTRKSIAKRKNIDPGFKVQCNLRNRLRDLIATVKRGGSSNISGLIGCSTKQLSKHLESKFKRGMTWSNYGTHWHVDHILPCSSFDHTNPRQVAQCWHWTNLRPLEAKKNLEKSNSITEPQMQLLLCVTH